MTGRIEHVFTSCKAQGRNALVTFIVAGDPDLATSATILHALPKSGADIIELGMPFTDPMADGPAIQAGDLRAIAAGMDLRKTIALVREFRTTNTTTPIVLMGYFNPIYAYGSEAFVKDAAAAGVDGLIVVDLPPEEDSELRIPAQQAGLDLIRLITPTTTPDRLKTVLRDASGFLYYVSVAGITGSKSASPETVAAHLATIKSQTSLPIVVGFGIRTPDDAKAMSRCGDGVVIGSKFVDLIAAAQPQNAANEVSAAVQGFRKALG